MISMQRKYDTAKGLPIYPDGLLKIYSVDDDGAETTILDNVYFRKMTLGYGKVFTAQANNVTINQVIRVPNCTGFNTHDLISILGEGIFEIVLIQDKMEGLFPEIELSLKQLELFTK